MSRDFQEWDSTPPAAEGIDRTRSLTQAPASTADYRAAFIARDRALARRERFRRSVAIALLWLIGVAAAAWIISKAP